MSIVEKVPVVDYDYRVAPGVDFPVTLEIPCEVLERTAGSGAVAIRLRYGIEDQDGRSVFNVDERAVMTRS